jgi:hypothetical protein
MPSYLQNHEAWWADLQRELRDGEDRFADWLDALPRRFEQFDRVTIDAAWARGACFTVYWRKGLVMQACVYKAKLQGDQVHVEALGPHLGKSWTEDLPTHR